MTSLPRARSTTAATAVAPSYRWWVLGITSLGALLSSLNSGTLVIALPDILRDLHTDLFALLWIVVGYTLVATVLVLNAGRLADMVGRAKMFTVGLGVFTRRLGVLRPRPDGRAPDRRPRSSRASAAR